MVEDQQAILQSLEHQLVVDRGNLEQGITMVEKTKQEKRDTPGERKDIHRLPGWAEHSTEPRSQGNQVGSDQYEILLAIRSVPPDHHSQDGKYSNHHSCDLVQCMEVVELIYQGVYAYKKLQHRTIVSWMKGKGEVQYCKQNR
jgi:hypothetical protein